MTEQNHLQSRAQSIGSAAKGGEGFRNKAPRKESANTYVMWHKTLGRDPKPEVGRAEDLMNDMVTEV